MSGANGIRTRDLLRANQGDAGSLKCSFAGGFWPLLLSGRHVRLPDFAEYLWMFRPEIAGRGLFPRPSRSEELRRLRSSASRAFLIYKVPATPARSRRHGARVSRAAGQVRRAADTQPARQASDRGLSPGPADRAEVGLEAASHQRRRFRPLLSQPG